MDVLLEKASLLGVVKSVQGALSNKSTLPVLNGVFLKANPNNLSAYATDLEISIKNTVKADVKKGGEVVVFGDVLLDIAKNLDDGRVNLSFNKKENKLLIKSGNSSFTLNTLPPEDLPGFPDTKGGEPIELKASDFTKSIRGVVVATSRDESRPTLTGVYVNPNQDGISFVATDSYRLSFRRIKTAKNPAGRTAIVPRRAIEEIIKAAPKEGTIKVTLSDKQVTLKNESLLFVTRVIGGQFPKFEQLFPKKHETKITIDREAFLQATKRMATLSSGTPLVLRAKKTGLTISSKNPDLGSGEETIPARGASKEAEVALNPRYLIDGLSAVDDKEVTLQLTDSRQPGLLRGSETEDYLYLIMPVRLN